MNEFNRMTIVAAAGVIADFNSHDDMEVLEVQWGISGRCTPTSKSARVASLARIAADEAPTVFTESGRVSLGRAMVETSIAAPDKGRQGDAWKKLVAGLRFDGFEINTTEIQEPSAVSWMSNGTKTIRTLVRMLPENIPGVDFREAESEVVTLLASSGFTIAKGHLSQAMSAFQRGEWSSANGELRNFYENYLNEIATSLGDAAGGDSKAKRDYLAACRT